MWIFPAVSLLAGAMGLVLAFVGSRFAGTPGWRDHRWFGLLAGSAAVYCFCDILVTLDLPDSVVLLGGRGNWVALATQGAAWILHSSAHIKTALDRRRRVLIGGCIVVGLLSLVPGAILTSDVIHHSWFGVTYSEPKPGVLDVPASAVLFLSFMVAMATYARALRTSHDAPWYLAGMTLLLVASVNDALASSGRFSLPYLLDAAFLPTIFMMGYVLIRRFVEGARRLDALSTKLEEMVSERTRELGEAHSALAQAERLAAIGRLSAGVAHEINNPAAAVMANLKYFEGAARKGTLPDDASETLQDTLASMEKIARIVRQLLDTGRVAAAENSALSNVRVARVARSAVRLAMASASSPASVDVSLDEELRVVADAGALEQILVNLILNGIQSVPVGRAPRIEIRAERDGEKVLIYVGDNGSGMSEETQRRLFEPFFTTKPFGKGTGLGLSVSLGLVRALGGDLAVATTRDEGTTMVVELARSMLERSSPPPQSLARIGLRKQVLVVDDERMVREALRRMLSRLFEVDVASSVDEAIRKVQTGSVDVLLCDVMMANGGGEVLYDRLRTVSPEHVRRIIFVTGGATDAASAEFLSRQNQPILYKPVDPVALIDSIDQVAKG